jgi:hypothetical protein
MGSTVMFPIMWLGGGQRAAHAAEQLPVDTPAAAAEVPVASCLSAGRPCVAISGFLQTEIADV